MGRQIKYMGTADIREVLKGDTFGGQLKAEDAIQKDVVFNAENFWVVDSDDAGLSEEQVKLLLEDRESFKDVTEAKRIPPNAHQTTFLGMRTVSDEEATLVSEAASTVSGTATTAGGSTAGSTGGTKGSGKSS